MRKCALFTAMFIFAVPLLAQAPAPLIQNVLQRRTISLDGDWHTLVDSRDIGINRHYFKNADPYSPSDRPVEYGFQDASLLHVPGDWNSQRRELFFYEGTVWYEKSFAFHSEPGHRTFFYAGAANYRAHVWVNGQSLCEHEGGFTPFNCDATALLKDGANFIVISVNDARHDDDIPSKSSDWWNYGGLTRDVALVQVPETFIQDYSVQLQRGPETSQRHITGWVKLSSSAAGQNVELQIPELKIARNAATDSNGLARFDFDVEGVQLWSPENPKLYDVRLAGGSDRVDDEIGFRTIETRGVDILLNGRPIFLRGIDLHEEAPYRSGRAHGDDDARTLLGWAKELGCNFVRLAHYPYDEHTTRMADRMGLLVWSEIPLWQNIAWKDPAVLAKARQQLAEMIGRDRNRAAVVFWSVSNETSPDADGRTDFLRALAAEARRLDSTRLIASALNHSTRTGPHAFTFDDPLITDLDAWGMNEYVGWYGGTLADIDATTWSTPYSKPMIVSEVGAGARQGLHGPVDQRWTEEYQAAVYKHQIAALRKIPFMRGMSPWCLKDFRSPTRQLPGIQDGFNRKGLISEMGDRKSAFYVLQEFYREAASQPNGETQ